MNNSLRLKSVGLITSTFLAFQLPSQNPSNVFEDALTEIDQIIYDVRNFFDLPYKIEKHRKEAERLKLALSGCTKISKTADMIFWFRFSNKIESKNLENFLNNVLNEIDGATGKLSNGYKKTIHDGHDWYTALVIDGRAGEFSNGWKKTIYDAHDFIDITLERETPRQQEIRFNLDDDNGNGVLEKGEPIMFSITDYNQQLYSSNFVSYDNYAGPYFYFCENWMPQQIAEKAIRDLNYGFPIMR